MFDLFGGVTNSQLNEVVKYAGINHLQLVSVLLDKGILTVEDLERSRVLATSIVDQQTAEHMGELRREFDEKHPGVREMFGKLFGGESE